LPAAETPPGYSECRSLSPTGSAACLAICLLLCVAVFGGGALAAYLSGSAMPIQNPYESPSFQYREFQRTNFSAQYSIHKPNCPLRPSHGANFVLTLR
jgi:hypothetical protein